MAESRFMEIELDGVVIRARLNTEKAPKTSQAVWDALPFEGRAVHAQVSGDMFRMLDETPVGDLELESTSYFQHPGSVVYYPGIKEIAFCIGKAAFAATQGFFKLTPLAELELEPDYLAWAGKGDDLRITGSKRIRFRRAADQTTPFRYPARRGRKMDVEFDGVRLTATLLEGGSPKAAAAFARALPLRGRAANSMWGAAVTRFYPEPARRGGLRLPARGLEAGTTFHWPGYIYYDPADGGVCICYGDGAEGLQGNPAALIPVACLDGDIAPFVERAQRQLMEGAKPMSMTLAAGARAARGAGRTRGAARRRRR
jgi:hypothetical protein